MFLRLLRLCHEILLAMLHMKENVSLCSPRSTPYFLILPCMTVPRTERASGAVLEARRHKLRLNEHSK